ncbi:MAG: trimethylamine methyltransferase family protein, partial [Deltaproteobacteria bacterium]|nr:trimethylamine methyltransferase family protein [Deltaproteobacteria bacterium]
QYLTHPRTLELCRTEFLPTAIMNRLPWDAWQSSGDTDIAAKAHRVALKRIAAYQKPDIPADIQKDLERFVEKRKHS